MRQIHAQRVHLLAQGRKNESSLPTVITEATTSIAPPTRQTTLSSRPSFVVDRRPVDNTIPEKPGFGDGPPDIWEYNPNDPLAFPNYDPARPPYYGISLGQARVRRSDSRSVVKPSAAPTDLTPNDIEHITNILAQTDERNISNKQLAFLGYIVPRAHCGSVIAYPYFISFYMVCSFLVSAHETR